MPPRLVCETDGRADARARAYAKPVGCAVADLYGKHVMGLGFNMLFYVGAVEAAEMRAWGWPLFLLNAGTLSITVFLHTLRFRGLLNPRYAFSVRAPCPPHTASTPRARMAALRLARSLL